MGVKPFRQGSKVMQVRLKFYLLYYTFRVNIKIRKSDLILYCSFSNFLAISITLHFHINFRIILSISVKMKLSKFAGNLMEIATNL